MNYLYSQDANWTSIRLYMLLRELTERSKNGILRFEDAKDNPNAILYDDVTIFTYLGFSNPQCQDMLNSYPVVRTYNINGKREIISYYDDMFQNISIRVCIDETETPYIRVRDYHAGILILIEDGELRFIEEPPNKMKGRIKIDRNHHS